MRKLFMNKKVISFILVLTMVLCATGTAFATITPVTPVYPMDVTVNFSAEEQTITDSQNVDHDIPEIAVSEDVSYASSGAFSTEFTVPSGATHDHFRQYN